MKTNRNKHKMKFNIMSSDYLNKNSKNNYQNNLNINLKNSYIHYYNVCKNIKLHKVSRSICI